jgi:hypothetical protein
MITTRRDLVQGAALSAGLGVLGALPEGARRSSRQGWLTDRGTLL